MYGFAFLYSYKGLSQKCTTSPLTIAPICQRHTYFEDEQKL